MVFPFAVDISEQPEVSRQYRVQAVPTLILLVNGQETERFVGLTDEAVLRRVMNAAARGLAKQQQAEAVPAEPEEKSEESSGGKSLGEIFENVSAVGTRRAGPHHSRPVAGSEPGSHRSGAG